MDRMLYWALTGDGPTDTVLQPIVEHLLVELLSWQVEAAFVGFAHAGETSNRSVLERLRKLYKRGEDEVYQANILLIHRDAESDNREIVEKRYVEIRDGIKAWKSENWESSDNMPLCVAMVPVQMSEAWLLCDEKAIREAFQYEGQSLPDMPKHHECERMSQPEPKSRLSLLIKMAMRVSRGRDERQFAANYDEAKRRLAGKLSLERLRLLPSFQTFEVELKDALALGNWDKPA